MKPPRPVRESLSGWQSWPLVEGLPRLRNRVPRLLNLQRSPHFLDRAIHMSKNPLLLMLREQWTKLRQQMVALAEGEVRSRLRFIGHLACRAACSAWRIAVSMAMIACFCTGVPRCLIASPRILTPFFRLPWPWRDVRHNHGWQTPGRCKPCPQLRLLPKAPVPDGQVRA